MSTTVGRLTTTEFSREALDHLGALYGFAMTLTGDQTEAQDLVQETYLRAVGAIATLLPDSNLKSWLFTIMRNIWLNQLRHARGGPRFVELDAEEDNHDWRFDNVAPDPQMLFLRKIEQDDVRKAIQSLPPLHRDVVVLRDIEGFTYQQIAGILGCPAGTVMSRLARARKKLRLLLSRWRPEVVRGQVDATNQFKTEVVSEAKKLVSKAPK
jgi:RNA polymerase sigma-70 factor (ECF subfamily)